MSSNQGASKGKFKTGDKNSPEDQVRLENQFLSSSFSGCVVFILTSNFVPSFRETGGGKPIPTVWGTLWITLNPSTKDLKSSLKG